MKNYRSFVPTELFENIFMICFHFIIQTGEFAYNDSFELLSVWYII